MKKLYRQSLVAISAVIFLFLSAASAKSTTGCSVMVPMMGTIWKTNEVVTVRWSGVNEGKIPAIILARTNEEGVLVDIAQIASDVPAAPGKHSLKLPANIPAADQYVIILKDVKKGKCTSNSFFIEQGV
ncbi:hypothetical protein BJV82DRAFT_626319 [Fennellomyces sp. T-0311]|nr:hypothetical protein BJV82DRAFT_626319 [Fennellomyces sp. T-0311]